MQRKYLLIQHLNPTKPEHAQIEARLASQAADVKQVFMTAGKSADGLIAVVGYLFTTDLPLRDLSFGPLMREDRILVVEVTGRHIHQGLSLAHNWLRTHQETDDASA